MTDISFRDLLPVLAGLGGVVVGFSLNVVRDALRDRALRRRIASALLAEMTELRARYWETFGEYISKWQPGQPLEKLRGAARNQNFFAVYDSNTDKLGMFKADDLRAVVRAYILGKAHVENVRQAADVFGASASHPGAHEVSSKVSDLHKEVGSRLKKESEVTLKATDEAIKILARYAGPL